MSSSSGRVLVRPERLRRLTASLLESAGSSSTEAAAVASNLVASNLCGHDSHGVGYLPEYLRTAVEGRLVVNQTPLVVLDAGPLVVVDGRRGYGQVMAAFAMERGIARAKEIGACVVSVRNSHHMGRIGAWAEMATAAGLASVHFTNVAGHEPLVAPHGGCDARLGTNPFTVGFPAEVPAGWGGGQDVVLDMATSKIALGKARNAFNEGRPLPEGQVLDARGYPSTDPGVMFPGAEDDGAGGGAGGGAGATMATGERGALTPLGEHKGFGMALASEILGGVATGGPTIAPHHEKPPAILNNMMAFVFDPAKTAGHSDVHANAEVVGLPSLGLEVDALRSFVSASPNSLDVDLDSDDGHDGIFFPGERANANRLVNEETGITLDAGTWESLREAGALVGVDGAVFDEALRTAR